MIIIVLQTTYSAKSISIGSEYTDEVSLNDWAFYGWETSKPWKQGSSQINILKMYNYIQDEELDIDHLLLLKNGYIIAERDFYIDVWSGNGFTVGYIVSTITATVIGIALT